MKPIGNLQEAVIVIKNLLLARGIKILDTNQVIVDYYQGKPIYHSRIITNLGIYHIKFQKKEQIPRSSTLMSGAVNADERLKFVIKMFGKELLSNIGINLNVILDLLEIEEKKQTKFTDKSQRITKPLLSKYEYVRLLQERTTQLINGAKPMIKNAELFIGVNAI